MNNNAAAGLIIGILAVLCVALVIGIAIGIMFLLSLQKALKRCSPRNRTMEPGMVWLNLIPLFNLYWWFHTVSNISTSLKNEFADRDMDISGDYGKTVGIWAMATNLVGSVLSNIGNALNGAGGGGRGGGSGAGMVFTLLALPISIAALVLFILYWVKIVGYSNQLGEEGDSGRRRRRDRDDDDDDRDDEDDRPIRRSRPDDRIR